jgi:hypothetical protein
MHVIYTSVNTATRRLHLPAVSYLARLVSRQELIDACSIAVADRLLGRSADDGCRSASWRPSAAEIPKRFCVWSFRR